MSKKRFLAALAPVAHELGATLVDAGEVRAGDVPVRWDGEVVAGLRMPDLRDALAHLISQVERELGAPLAELSREDKQRAVRALDDRGAFVLRKSVEDVADVMGVSRMTIYSYLDALNRED
jgi:hypothetical protein